MSNIKLGIGGYRDRPAGWEGDLGGSKNNELVKAGRAEYIGEAKQTKKTTKKGGKKTYENKELKTK